MEEINQDSRLQLHTGRTMPIIGLGTWGLQRKTANVVARALTIGYPMIDTSGDYGTQPGIAQGIIDSGALRDSFYLVTKVEETDEGYEATRKNLTELELDYADLVLIHRPPEEGVGEDIWRGLLRARQEGFIKDIGVSNYSEMQIQTLANLTGEMPVVNQIEWSPFGWSQSMLEFCHANGIIIQAYSPLTHGKRLSEKALRAISSKHRKTVAQVLIRWSLQMGVVPLPKANRSRHLEDNLNVFDFELTENEMESLSWLNEQYSALGNRPIYEEQ